MAGRPNLRGWNMVRKDYGKSDVEYAQIYDHLLLILSFARQIHYLPGHTKS